MADFYNIRNPEIRKIFDTLTGHDHDGANTKAVVGGAPAADSITNAMIKSDAAIVASKFAAAVQASLVLADTAMQTGAALSELTPVNAVGSNTFLDVTGVVIDGGTFLINGIDNYEFAADAAQGVGAGNLAVDIEAHTTKSACKLTVAAQMTIGDYMDIGGKLYTFSSILAATGEGDISIGSDLATGQAAIIAAINGTDGHNTANANASAAAFTGGGTTESIITALIGGVAGDALVSTSNFTNGGNLFDATTFGTEVAGVDCIAANAILAIVIAVAALDTQGVGAVDGAGDTAVFTADVKGVVGDSITTVATMANGAFDAAALAGGVDGTVGVQWSQFIDASYLYYCIAANTIADANWRRVSLGSAY